MPRDAGWNGAIRAARASSSGCSSNKRARDARRMFDSELLANRWRWTESCMLGDRSMRNAPPTLIMCPVAVHSPRLSGPL